MNTSPKLDPTYPVSERARFGGELYAELLAQALSYFFPDGKLVEMSAPGASWNLRVSASDPDGEDTAEVQIEWLGQRHRFLNGKARFTQSEFRLIRNIGRVLSARYEALFDRDLAARNFHLFRGLPEDRHVSAFLDPTRYADWETVATRGDRVADAIEVLRASSLTTYENRRVSTGVLLLAPADSTEVDSKGELQEPLQYTSTLTSIRSFHRLCDGIHTVSLVDGEGRWRDVVDLEQWVTSAGLEPPPHPGAAIFRSHCTATYKNRNLCLVLTPNGEIKAFAEGVQVFSYLNGRWRLTDFKRKHRLWGAAIPVESFADSIFQVALDLADSRRGALFVVLDDAASASRLVGPADLLNARETHPVETPRTGSKQSLYYLLQGKRGADMAPFLLKSLASIDGSVVFDKTGQLLAFGAILRHHVDDAYSNRGTPEGGRTTAALAASHFGSALKVSEDGVISFFHQGALVWEI